MALDGTSAAGVQDTSQVLALWQQFAEDIKKELEATRLGAGGFDPSDGWDPSPGPQLSRPGSLSSADIADAVESLLQQRTQVNEDVSKGNIADNKLKIKDQREAREAKKEEVASAQKEAADKAAKAGVFNKVFGWVMAV